MDKRIIEMLEMQRNLSNSTSSPAVIPSCINTDYCVSTPRNMNDGILTMAFVDMQPLESVYPPETAYHCGSLFPNITKPFYGGKMR